MSTKSGIPGYKIIKLLGKGGMAAVYLAIQESFGREVALKVLPPSQAQDEEFSKRFIREAQIVSRLIHPNIVTVYDVGVQNGYHYLSMEYVPGKDLKQSGNQFSKSDAVRIVREVAKALDYAAKLGYVHRDVKPENIMLHEDGERVILMDFGIARLTNATTSVTTTGKVIGTPHYMSPEQTKGLQVDSRSDIYSLGVVFYQLLSSHVPYDAETPVAVGIKHISEPIPMLPAGLEIFQPVINTCMSKNPEHRYQTAGELIKALDSLDMQKIRQIDAKVAAMRQPSSSANGATMVASAATSIVDSPVYDSQPRPSQPRVGIPPLIHPHPRKSTITRSVEMEAVEEEGEKKKSRVGLWFLILLLLTGGVAFAKQDEIKRYWDETLNAEVYALSQKMGLDLPWLKPGQSSASVDKTGDVAAGEAVIDSPASAESNTSDTLMQQDAVPVRERVRQLRESLQQQPENALELARVYKAMLKRERGKLPAQKGIKELQEWYQGEIEQGFTSGDLQKVRQRLDMLQQSFPRIAQRPLYQEQVARLQKEQQLEAHMQKATTYLEIKAWESAHKEYLAVIASQPEHQEAREAIKQLVQLTYDDAREERKQGNFQKAMETVEAGLKANDAHRGLISLKKTLEKDLERQQKIAAALLKAEQLYSQGKYVEPRNASAYHYYKQVKMLEPGNAKASKGMRDIENYYIGLSTRSRMAGKYDESLKYLQKAQEYFGNTPVIDAARQDLSKYISIEQPKISNIFFSATQSESNPHTASSSLQLVSTLFIGFDYDNFPADSTPLVALLMDGSGQKVILKKNIRLKGRKGEHLFDITLPQSATFAEGRYTIEVQMEGKPLINAGFVVDNTGVR